jgi:hypothetical protein
MKYVKTALWVVCLIGITVLFNISFRMVFTPDGLKGEVTVSNIVVSWAYLLFWVGLSVVSGIWKDKCIFTAGIIYSSLPFVSLIGIPFLGTRLAYIVLIFFYCGVPVQGISPALVYCQLPIFLLGYKVGNKILETAWWKRLKKIEDSKNGRDMF